MKHARNAAPGLLGVAQNLFASLGTTGKVISGTLAAVVAATPFGAWNAVADDAIPLAADATVEVGPYEVVIEKVVSTKTLGDVQPLDPADKLLVVVAEVTNTSDVPAHAHQLADIVPAPVGAGVVDTESRPVPDDAEPGDRPLPNRYNIADAGELDVINPGVTYRVALVWNQDGDAAPETVRVDLAGLHWIEEGFAGLDDEYWLPTDEVTHSGMFDVEPPKSQAGNGSGSGGDGGGADAGEGDTGGAEASGGTDTGGGADDGAGTGTGAGAGDGAGAGTGDDAGAGGTASGSAESGA
ncbi:hypothetical protein [Myceligenerans pegani]|uniref:DUF11 domain-containing protein n=1 Tax=Myceligenerans pegani TaxID=2776917 RepID=A0ABR9N5X2_9MICO|nr:hypothetical protein [Myceligenerans sp. TRM 65318]MBE1878666.1 hypothetical protein [Myceligenerans sp. TRM 65318]MBE3020937.1 hypothetical protein [Myceligenerans sp. TRM 65318]